MSAQFAPTPAPGSNAPIQPENVHYLPLAQLPLFANAPAIAMSPPLARAWAKAIVYYWQCCLADASLQPGQRLYLLDLAPGDGQVAWMLLPALEQSLAEAGLQVPLTWLAACDDAANLAQHPYLQDWIKAGVLQCGQWQADGWHGPSRLTECDNPLVVVSLGHFARLPAQVIWPHHGHILHGRVRVVDAPAPDQAPGLQYLWQPDQELLGQCADPVRTELHALMQYYLLRGHASAILLPTGAAELLSRLHAFCHGQYLLLASAKGSTREAAIRLGALYPPGQLDGVAPPVNFHALAWLAEQHGALCWQQQIDDDDLVMHVACASPQVAVDQARHRFACLCQHLASHHPQDSTRLATLWDGMPIDPGQILTLLRLVGHDPLWLAKGIEAINANPPQPGGSLRGQWQQALLQTWHQHFPVLGDTGFSFQVALLAMHLEYWPLARECLCQGLNWYGAEPGQLYLLAYCAATTGDPDYALELLEHALSLAPDHPQAQALCLQLHARQQRWLQTRWYLPAHAKHGALRLQPLGPEHAPALFYQYRDPEISELTALPDLNNLADTLTWINEMQEPARAVFAVMHEDNGFVGMVAMHCAGNAGYFYFWMGVDYQDQGIGQQAAQCLISMLARCGINEVFTSAFANNHRSQHALHKLGFQDLGVQACEPDDDLLFFYRGEVTDGNAGLHHRNLSRLCCAIGSSFQFSVNP